MTKEVIQLVKVSIEVHSEVRRKPARFSVAGQAQTIQRALSVAAARYPVSVARVKFPTKSEGFLVEDSAARAGPVEAIKYR